MWPLLQFSHTFGKDLCQFSGSGTLDASGSEGFGALRRWGVEPVPEDSSLRFSSRPWGFEFLQAYISSDKMLHIPWFKPLLFLRTAV